MAWRSVPETASYPARISFAETLNRAGCNFTPSNSLV